MSLFELCRILNFSTGDFEWPYCLILTILDLCDCNRCIEVVLGMCGSIDFHIAKLDAVIRKNDLRSVRE